MRRRTRLLLLAAATGLIAPTVVNTAAGAIDQDLVVSATSGPVGSSIAVSSASCVPNGGDGEAYLSVSMYSGTAPDEQIIAYATGYNGDAELTIPDWVDPDQPAVIEATCEIYGNTEETLAYDPVAFDIEPGIAPPVQVRTFSRTELLAGQGFTVAGECGPALANGFVTAIAVAGTDQTGRLIESLVGEGYADADGTGAFELEVFLTNASLSLNIEVTDDEVSGIGIEEEPMDIPAGDYTVFTYCSDQNEESLQFLEPQLLAITGDAPTTDIELTNTPNTRDVTLAGTCAAGDVTGVLESIGLDEFSEFDAPSEAVRDQRFRTSRSTDKGATGLAKRIADANLLQVAGSDRALVDEGFVEFAAATGADGSWSTSDSVGFDEGVVAGIAICGDPLGDGYFYDPQGVGIEVIEVPPTVPTTVPVAPAPPANAVAGTPDYAG
jgi:hypothetical protein